MTKLVWNQNDVRPYELGVDRGVFYPMAGPGVAWNGLRSVNEVRLGAQRNEYFLDGVKYMEYIENANYQATIRTISTPQEFDRCIGIKSIVSGFSLTNQPKTTFGLSYRTLIAELGYKIHIVYNATATPANRTYSSQSGTDASPLELEWKIDAVPPASTIYRPTAHFVIDSTKIDPDILNLLEILLYGTDARNSELPDVAALIELFSE